MQRRTVQSAEVRQSSIGVQTVGALVEALRPKQWTKNAVVFAALVFTQQLFALDDLLRVTLAAACFMLASGATYLYNDLLDYQSDRAHPVKRNRPIASGRLHPAVASIAAIMLAVTSLAGAFVLRPQLAAVIGGYLVLMIAYTKVLKHIMIVDVFVIAAGFVLRAAAGAVAIDVPISPWLYVCTILLSLFIGFAKRRHELVLLQEDAGSHRKNLDNYSVAYLDQLISIVSAATIIAYSLYTFSAPNLPINHAMMVTIPFVIYGMFRYLHLVHAKDGGGAPEQAVLGDRPLLISVFLWGMTTIAVLYTPWY